MLMLMLMVICSCTNANHNVCVQFVKKNSNCIKTFNYPLGRRVKISDVWMVSACFQMTNLLVYAEIEWS